VNGFYFYVRKTDTIELDMSVDVALRTIVSMGVVATPEAVHPVGAIHESPSTRSDS
jgi:uncharacterized membrane protein